MRCNHCGAEDAVQWNMYGDPICVFCKACAYDPPVKPPRVVWLRSNHVSYSKELPASDLQPKGVIVNHPELTGFVWEPWP